jgi:hypothetical protein
MFVGLLLLLWAPLLIFSSGNPTYQVPGLVAASFNASLVLPAAWGANGLPVPQVRTGTPAFIPLPPSLLSAFSASVLHTTKTASASDSPLHAFGGCLRWWVIGVIQKKSMWLLDVAHDTVA